ncbi:MAG: hypothetical protein JRN15_10710 [Nitrososphaerota archaeon]|nr:hypothetical protein [Nitrososphaerota archaeon]
MPNAGAASLTGYLYQVKTCLVWALEKLSRDSAFRVALETLDDVVFYSAEGDPRTVLQTKHHVGRRASLTDASPDIWRTFALWLAQGLGGTQSQHLILLTTEATQPNSAANYLTLTRDRNVNQARERLITVARTSHNAENTQGYRLFLQLSTDEQLEFLNSLTVIDSAPSMSNLDDDLRAAVYPAVSRAHVEPFLERLEGWWLRRVLQGLTDGESVILAEEIDFKLSDLREQFSTESLPIDDEVLDAPIDFEVYADQVFVEQIKITGANEYRVLAAIRDYYRAFEHRSRWTQDGLLRSGELVAYERELQEAWELRFARMMDDVGKQESEETKQSAGRKLLEWAEDAHMPIRPRVSKPFVTSGSLHMLSDQQKIGWHIDFRMRLAGLLVSHD